MTNVTVRAADPLSPPLAASAAPPVVATGASAVVDEQKLLDDALKAYQDEYKDRSETWRTIESKAQAVVTAGGAFLGGLFALTQKMEAPVPPEHVTLIIVSVAALSGAVVSGLFALKLRRISEPPTGTFVFGDTVAICRTGSPTAEAANNLKRDIARIWGECVTSVAAANRQKAGLVRLAQILIGVGALSVSVLTLALLIARVG